jgi:hypothetical protein
VAGSTAAYHAQVVANPKFGLLKNVSNQKNKKQKGFHPGTAAATQIFAVDFPEPKKPNPPSSAMIF